MSFPTTLDGLFINGKWSAGSEHLRVINPATEALLTTVNGGDANAVDDAVNAATEAFLAWSQTTGTERGAILRKIAAGVQAGREQLMQLQSSNNGKPLFEAAIDVDDVIATFEYYAGLAEGLDARQDSNVELPTDDFSARVRREPCGVVGLIVP
jgi:betaine-aldehyde dehydrogenase